MTLDRSPSRDFKQVRGPKSYVPVMCTWPQNCSRLLWVLLSSAQELLYHEGFTVVIVSGDGTSLVKRPTRALLSISTSTPHSPRGQGRGQIPPVAVFYCSSLSPSTAQHTALLPYWVQHVKNQDKQQAGE